MRVLVGFFGLNRALRQTIENIDRNIFGVLHSSGIDCVRVGHFNLPDLIISPRSGERGVKASDDGISLLGLEICWIEKQTEKSISSELEKIAGFPWRGEEDEGFHMRRNALWQLHSLQRLGALIGLIEGNIDFYVLLRPDLIYIDPLPVNEIISAIETGADLITPSWASHLGLNDRFAICSKAGMMSFVSRIKWISSFVESRRYFHAEELLLYTASSENLKVATMGMRATRVRSTGYVVTEDF